MVLSEKITNTLLFLKDFPMAKKFNTRSKHGTFTFRLNPKRQ